MVFNRTLFKEKVDSIQQKYYSDLQKNKISLESLYHLISDNDQTVLKYIPHPNINNEIKKEIIRAFDTSHQLRMV